MRRANKIRLARQQRDEAHERWRIAVDMHSLMVTMDMAIQLESKTVSGPPRPPAPEPDPGCLEGASKLRQLRHEVKFWNCLADEAAEKLGELILRG